MFFPLPGHPAADLRVADLAAILWRDRKLCFALAPIRGMRRQRDDANWRTFFDHHLHAVSVSLRQVPA